jgi:hypothetical protein
LFVLGALIAATLLPSRRRLQSIQNAALSRATPREASPASLQPAEAGINVAAEPH